MMQLIEVIESAWENRAELKPGNANAEIAEAVEHCIGGLDAGELRVAEPGDGGWVVNEWLKKAVLLYFRINDNEPVGDGSVRFFDKVPLKYAVSMRTASAPRVPASSRGRWRAAGPISPPAWS